MEEKLSMEVRGRDMVSGLPKTITVTSDDVTDAIQKELEDIQADAAKAVFGKDCEYRFLVDSFPFTDPSVQIEVKMPASPTGGRIHMNIRINKFRKS